MSIASFETKRLILKGVTSEDISAYTKHFVDYEIIRHLSANVPWPYPDNGVETFLTDSIFPHQGKTHWLWGLFLKDNPDEVVGAIELWREGRPEHRGFWLSRKHQGKGLMTEAVEPITDYAFDCLGFEKLIFENALGNVRSRRVKEKTGATFIKIEPAKFVDPEYKEHEIWELTAENWKLFKNK